MSSHDQLVKTNRFDHGSVRFFLLGLIFISMVGSYLILLTTSNMDAHLKRMTSFGAFTGAILGFSYGLSDAPEGKSRSFLNRFSFGMFTTALGSFILAAALGLPPLLYGEVHDFYRTLL